MSFLIPKSYLQMPKADVITGMTQYINIDQLVSSNTLSNSTSATIEISADGMLGNNLKQKIMEEIMAQFSYRPLVRHQCHSCGATLDIDANNHIFICKYCGSVYAFDTNMANDKGDI